MAADDHAAPLATREWWRDAVIYQVYIRSFGDGNGDGIGDIAGIRERLPYLARLGVDAVWINPWYPSPMADGGYDVADFRDIDPVFGRLADAEALIEQAHAHGLRILLDVVPNHTSDQHAWFRAALASAPGSPERARYIFRDGRGDHGELPPNDWRSVFGGSAWTRTSEPDGRPGQWFLHLFDVTQPDLDWTNPQVPTEFADILRFWFDRGADGFRIDVAHGLVKDPALPDLGAHHPGGADPGPLTTGDHPHWDRDELHDIYREWRRIADSYDPPRMYVAEAWVASPDRMARYLQPGGLHTAFAFDLVRQEWDPAQLRRAIDDTIEALTANGAPATWVLSNHDVTRHASRFGRKVAPGRTADAAEAPAASADATGDQPVTRLQSPDEVDADLGRFRARAAALLLLALPGSAYLYQGEELGLGEVLDLPTESLQDPVWIRSGGKDRGRDGSRVPLPWRRHGPSLGFGDGQPWLPQPAAWAELSVEAQEEDPSSMLHLYRAALRVRRRLVESGEASDTLTWETSAPEVLSFRRGRFRCVVNLGPDPVELPPGEVLLSSAQLVGGALPSDAAAWVRGG